MDGGNRRSLNNMLLALLLCFVFLHGNAQWSFVLYVVGLIMIGIAAFFDGRRTMTAVVAGYNIGFALGLLFGTYSTNAYDELVNNRHEIWLSLFTVALLIGIIWDVLAKPPTKPGQRDVWRGPGLGWAKRK